MLSLAAEGISGELSLSPSEAAMRKLWEALDELDQATPPKPIFRVIIFGSARISRDHRIYRETKEMARAIAERGIDIVTGGGPGLMAAANEGAVIGHRKNKRSWSHGVCIENINRVETPNEFLKHAYRHRLIFTRLHHFIRLAHFGAIILGEAGGYGSDLEKALSHQLRQFGQLNVPLIGIGPMWEERAAWEKKWLVDTGYANPEDMSLLTPVATAMEAVPIVLDAYGRFKKSKVAG